MGEVSGAVEVIRSQLAVLHEACDRVSHRELVGVLSELTTVTWSVPGFEHRVLNRLVAETEPTGWGSRRGRRCWSRRCGRHAPVGPGRGTGAPPRDDRRAVGAVVGRLFSVD